jgi:signal transduction histidine kinase
VRFFEKIGLVPKLVFTLVFLTLLPAGVMMALSLRHLGEIREAAVNEAKDMLTSSQVKLLKERLDKEEQRLTDFFSRIRNDANTLSSFATEIVRTLPTLVSDPEMTSREAYIASGRDGESVVFVPHYVSSLQPAIAATKSIEFVMKPMVEQEPKIVFSWLLYGDGAICRGYPWKNFGNMPRKNFKTWPFYYLAGPEYNPGGSEAFTGVYLDPLSGEWMISCMSPVLIDGQHRATAGLDITIQNLLQTLNETRLTEDSIAILMSASGIIAASENVPFELLGMNPNQHVFGQDLSHSSMPEIRDLAHRVMGTKGGVELVDSSQGRFFAGHVSIEPPAWKLLMLIPEENVISPALESAGKIGAETRVIRSNFLHILVFAFIGILALAMIVFHHQSKGLRSLLRGIRTIGEGDLKHRVEQGNGEFGLLSRAINTMAESLLEKKEELQRVYGEMEQSRKLAAVGRLAAGVAHEVNNPLTTISAYTQLLRRREDMPSHAMSNLDTISEEIRRIQDKLRNLLDLSRLQSLSIQWVQPNELVRQVVELAQHEATAQGIGIHLDLESSDRLAPLDRAGFKQILWNLLGNASESQKGGGNIWVRSRFESMKKNSPAFVLAVEDEGEGIEESLLSRIFEPFFTTKEIGQGTGLGLAVCYRIVEGHGGSIEVKNLSPRGCLFRVIFPCEVKE